MSVFKGILGDWIQIYDEKNDVVIDDYGYETGIVSGTVGNHCVKCVAVNKCWFKDMDGRKPERFDTTNIDVFDYIIKGVLPGLYHFKCHCEEVPIVVNGVDDVKLIIPEGKRNYLFNIKGDWVRAMGYKDDEFDKFFNILLTKTKEAYFYGNYYIENITKYGCKINLLIDIPGENEKLGKNYSITTNYMIFPNGRLKMNTPIGGWQ